METNRLADPEIHTTLFPMKNIELFKLIPGADFFPSKVIKTDGRSIYNERQFVTSTVPPPKFIVILAEMA